jgi:hypothetical protein
MRRKSGKGKEERRRNKVPLRLFVPFGFSGRGLKSTCFDLHDLGPFVKKKRWFSLSDDV